MGTNLFNSRVYQVAEGYCKKYLGDGYCPKFTEITQAQGTKIADAFNASAQAQYTPEALHCYAQFCQELALQYAWIIAHGLTVEAWAQDGQPYENSQAVYTDVLENNHLYFFLTDAGFGSDGSVDYSRHPLLEKSGFILNGYELCFNDLFRIVHDYFGHAIYGFQFGPKGETNAYQSHLAMFITRSAKRALSTEAQGQTCFFNYGQHLRRADGSLPAKGEADYLPLNNRPYADQFVAVLPVRAFLGVAKF